MRKLLILLMGLFLFSAQIFAQSRVVNGRVTDAKTGEPLPGVSVTVKNGPGGTQTSSDGNYSITVPSSRSVLMFSYVGFDANEVVVGEKNTVNIALSLAGSGLQEVIVTGYTTERKKNFTGAASQVTASEIKNSTFGSLDQMLQGRVPGLSSLAGSGQPGSGATVRIRGSGSISGGNTPLYILDGVPLEAGLFRGLNANDFETVTVLKDAAATAQYGARAANGVIVITSKRGRAGETRVTARNQYGQSTRTGSKFEMMNTQQRLQFEEILGLQIGSDPLVQSFPGWRYSKKNPAYAALPVTAPGFGASQQRYDFILDSISKIDVDWQSVFFRTGIFQQHELEVSGGTEKTRFLLTGNFYNQEGIAIRSDLTRYNLRANIENYSGRFRISNMLNLNFNKSNFIESENGVALANPFAAAFLALPYQKLRNETADTNYTGSGLVGPNAYDRIFTTTSRTNQMKANNSLTLGFKITDWLSARTLLGLDYRQSDNTRFVKPISYVGFLTTPGRSGSFGEGFSRYFSYTTTSGFDLGHTFFNKLEAKSSLLYEHFREYSDNFSFTGFGLNPKLPNTPAAIAPNNLTTGVVPVVSGGNNSTALESYIGLSTFTWDEKYTLQANLRKDGTSRALNNRYVTLWSVGASWLLTNEQFMQNINQVNYLKLRASYGTAANNSGFPGDFTYLSLYGNSSYGGVQGLAPTSIGNPDIDWEVTKIANLGVEFGFFRDRFTGSFEVYDKKTDALFINQRLSNTAGLNSNPTLSLNAGEVENKGFEWDLRGVVVKSRNFEWALTANGNKNKNEIIDLGQVTEFIQGTSIIRVGLPLGTHYDRKWAGVDPQTGEPMYFLADGKTTTDYNAAPQFADYGTSQPPQQGGFGTDLTWKSFSISGFFTYAKGYSRYNNESFFYEYGNPPNVQFNQSAEMLNIWQKPGDITDFQSPKYARQFSSKDIEDASFIRFRDLTFGYSLSSLANKTKYVKGGLFYIKANNVATWTKWRGNDPEDSNNIAQYEYPLSRTITVGLDISF